MSDLRMPNRPAGFFAVVLFLPIAFSFSGCSTWRGVFGGDSPANVIKVEDIEGRKVVIGKGTTHVIVGATAQGLRPPKVPRDYLPPNALADPDVRLVYVVDLADKLPAMLHRGVRSELSRTLQNERKKLRSAHKHLGMKRNPDDAVTLIFDPEGAVSQQLGLDYGGASLAVAIYDRSGSRAYFHRGLSPRPDLLAQLGRIRAGASPAPSASEVASTAYAAPRLRPASDPADAPIVVTPSAELRAGTPPPPPLPQVSSRQSSRPDPAAEFETAKRRADSVAREVKNGSLVRFAPDSLAFVPQKQRRQFAPPGAMQDAATASAARARLAPLRVFGGQEPRVRCASGVLTIDSPVNEERELAELVERCLDLDGVTEVRIVLPQNRP